MALFKTKLTNILKTSFGYSNIQRDIYSSKYIYFFKGAQKSWKHKHLYNVS